MPNEYPEIAEGNDAQSDAVASDPRTIAPRVSAPSTSEDYSLNRYRPMATGRRSLPDLTVENAYKTLQFLQENPRFLTNPYTRHAAESVFGAASKVISTSVQLEGINARIEATKARNGLAMDVGRNLLKMQMKGGASAEVAAKWNALGEDGKPLWQDSSNWQAIMKDASALEEPEKPLGIIGRNLHDELAFYRSGGTKEQWEEAVKTYAGSRGEYVGPYIEPTIKEIGGKSFMFYRNFSPKALDRLTPQQQQMLNVNVLGLKEARKNLTDATDDVTREEAQKVYNRELSTFNEFFDMVSPRASATPGTNAPAASAPTNPAAQKAEEANKIASENPGWTRQQIIDEVNRRFAR